MLRQVYSGYRLWLLAGAVAYLLGSAIASTEPELRGIASLLRMLSGALFLLDGLVLVSNWQGAAEHWLAQQQTRGQRANTALAAHRFIGAVFALNGLGFVMIALATLVLV